MLTEIVIAMYFVMSVAVIVAMVAGANIIVAFLIGLIAGVIAYWIIERMKRR